MRRFAASCAALLLACGGGNPAPRPPATPGHLVAHAGDGQATVLWDASDGALGLREFPPPYTTSTTIAAPFTGSANVIFSNRDFVAFPFQFKAFNSPNPTDHEAGANHAMDDDVINTRTLTWTAGDGATF